MNIAVTAKATTPATTRTVAEFAVGLRYEDLPPEVVAMAKRCILDSLGCGVFGAQPPWTQAVTRVVSRLGQATRASAWGQKGTATQLGAMAKRFHSGKASQNGIIAAYCAREGLTGVRDVLEAEYGGFCSAYSREYDLSWATKGLGTGHWEILKNGFKRS